MKIFLIILFALLVVSCDEDNLNSNDAINGQSTLLSYFYNDSLTFNGYILNDESQSSSSFASQTTQAIFWKDSTRISAYNVGDFYLDGELFNKQADNMYYSSFEFDRGSNLNIRFLGNLADSIPSFNDTIYYPENIKISNFSAYDSVSKSGFTLNWNSDPNSTEDVIIRIVYSSRKTDHTFPSNTFLNGHTAYKWIETDDDGSYNVSSSDLSTFDANSVIEIRIFRGNSEVFELKPDYNFVFLTYGYDKYYLKLYN